MEKNNRRHFIKTSAAIGALTAFQQNRVLGANDRVQVGIIGCGGRGGWHIGWLHRTAETEKLEVMAGCDIWNIKRDGAAAEIKKRFNNEPVMYKEHLKLLENKDIDAVVVATPDHLHCPFLADAVKAGKDVYVEKTHRQYARRTQRHVRYRQSLQTSSAKWLTRPQQRRCCRHQRIY